MRKIIGRIMGRTPPEKPEKEQDIEVLRERKREIIRASGVDPSCAPDEVLDALDIIKRPFHLR